MEKFAIAVLGTNFHPLLAFDCLISVLMVRTVDSRWGVTPLVGHTAGPDKTEKLPAAWQLHAARHNTAVSIYTPNKSQVICPEWTLQAFIVE